MRFWLGLVPPGASSRYPHSKVPNSLRPQSWVKRVLAFSNGSRKWVSEIQEVGFEMANLRPGRGVTPLRAIGHGFPGRQSARSSKLPKLRKLPRQSFIQFTSLSCTSKPLSCSRTTHSYFYIPNCPCTSPDRRFPMPFPNQ